MDSCGLASLSQVAEALNLAPPERDLALTGITTDTRQLTPGALFIALRGERFDAHAF